MSDERNRQCARILDYLEAHEEKWMPVFDLLAVSRSLNHTARITEIRHQIRSSGRTIENKIEHGHSFYRIHRLPAGEQLRLLDVA